MGSLTKQGSKYSDEDRRQVVAEYLITGNMKKVAKSTGIPHRTLNDWKKADWWDDVVATVRAEKAEELDANFTENCDIGVAKNGELTKRRQVAHKPREPWSQDKKAECAITLLTCGSIKQAAKQCHVPVKTLGHWALHDEYFIEKVASLQDEKSIEHQNTYSLIVDKAQQITLEKLDEATAAQANLIACQASDKALLLGGKPTTITSTPNSIEHYTKFFTDIANKVKAEQAKRANSIDGECEEIK